MPLLESSLSAAGLFAVLVAPAVAAPVDGSSSTACRPRTRSRARSPAADGNRWFTLGTEFTNAPRPRSRASRRPAT